MGVITTKCAVVLMALSAMACAAAPKSVTPVRAPLRPAAECAEVRARVDRGELVAGRDSVFAPTIRRVPFVDPRPYRDMPTGPLRLHFFVSVEGRVEPETIQVTGYEGHPYRNAVVRELLAAPFFPAVFENCAVRDTVVIVFSNSRRQ